MFNFSIQLRLDLGYKALIFASTTKIESGPRFTDIWSQGQFSLKVVSVANFSLFAKHPPPNPLPCMFISPRVFYLYLHPNPTKSGIDIRGTPAGDNKPKKANQKKTHGAVVPSQSHSAKWELCTQKNTYI